MLRRAHGAPASTAHPAGDRGAPHRGNIGRKAKIVALTAADYRSVVHELARLGLSGGVVYDAIVARAAAKAQVQGLLTFNPDHFTRVWPEGAEIVSVP